MGHAQDIKGLELLEKTIAYHDPDDNWKSLAVKLTFAAEERNGKTINRVVEFKEGGNYFGYYGDDGENQVNQFISDETCTFSLNGLTTISKDDMKKFKLSCERTQRIRNYYVYLYGLPMKLKDEGTKVDKKVTYADFMGVNYLKLRITYDAEVGNDIWYFYINPDSYKMEAYQFYHDEEKGDGEYITLEGIVEIDGIKIPKLRKWYTNKEDKFLGADDLAKIEAL